MTTDRTDYAPLGFILGAGVGMILGNLALGAGYGLVAGLLLNSFRSSRSR